MGRLEDARERQRRQARVMPQERPEYLAAVAQVDPLVRGLRLALLRRGYGNLGWRRRVSHWFDHHAADSRARRITPLNTFVSSRQIAPGIWWDICPGQNMARLREATNRFTMGITSDDWEYLRSHRDGLIVELSTSESGNGRAAAVAAMELIIADIVQRLGISDAEVENGA